MTRLEALFFIVYVGAGGTAYFCIGWLWYFGLTAFVPDADWPVWIWPAVSTYFAMIHAAVNAFRNRQ